MDQITNKLSHIEILSTKKKENYTAISGIDKHRNTKYLLDYTFYKNNQHNFDFFFKRNSNLETLLLFNNSKYQGGLIYRNSDYNLLMNLNLRHDQSIATKVDEKENLEKKLKFGFTKQQNLNNNLDAFVGLRTSFLFSRLAKNFTFTNVKFLGGLTQSDASFFVKYTNNLNSNDQKLKANFFLKALPSADLFGELISTKEKGQEVNLNFGLGTRFEYGKRSVMKLKVTSEKTIHFNLLRKINENMNINFVGFLGLKKENNRKIESNIGFNIEYSDLN